MESGGPRLPGGLGKGSMGLGQGMIGGFKHPRGRQRPGMSGMAQSLPPGLLAKLTKIAMQRRQQHGRPSQARPPMHMATGFSAMMRQPRPTSVAGLQPGETMGPGAAAAQAMMKAGDRRMSPDSSLLSKLPPGPDWERIFHIMMAEYAAKMKGKMGALIGLL